MTTQKTRFSLLQLTSKDTRLHILQDPTNLELRQASSKKGTWKQLGSRTNVRVWIEMNVRVWAFLVLIIMASYRTMGLKALVWFW